MVKQKIDIERLVHWTLIEQAALQVTNAVSFREQTWLRGLKTLSGRFDDWATLGGVHISSSGGAARLHPDAEAVIETMNRVPGGHVVRHYGRLGQRPEWYPEARFRYVPVLRKEGTRYQGRPDVVSGMTLEPNYDGRPVTYRNSRHLKQPCCLVRLEYEPELVVAARETYLIWWGGLAELVDALKGTLRDYEPTGPEVPAMPWGRRAETFWRERLRDARDSVARLTFAQDLDRVPAA